MSTHVAARWVSSSRLCTGRRCGWCGMGVKGRGVLGSWGDRFLGCWGAGVPGSRLFGFSGPRGTQTLAAKGDPSPAEGQEQGWSISCMGVPRVGGQEGEERGLCPCSASPSHRAAGVHVQQPWVLSGCRGPSPATLCTPAPRSNVPQHPHFVPLRTRSRSFAGCCQQPRAGNRVACLFAGSRKAPAVLKAGFMFLEAARGCLYVLTLQTPLPLPSRPQKAGFRAGLCTRGEQSTVLTAPAATCRLWDPVWVQNTSMLRLLLPAFG